MLKDIFGGTASLAILADVILQGGDFLLFAADYLVTPAIMITMTILPNIDLPGNIAWVYDAMIAVTVVLAIAYALNKARGMWRSWQQRKQSRRQHNGS